MTVDVQALAGTMSAPIGCSQAATASGTAFARRSAAAVASLPATTARRSAGIACTAPVSTAISGEVR
jgi:hypothetical protein